MAGRRPTPEALKQLAGNPGHRPARATVKPTGLARCPPWLHPIAKTEWKRLAPELELLGLLSAIDQSAFAGYCDAYSTWVLASKALQSKGSTYLHGGLVKQRPEVGIREKARSEMRKFAQEFGMTASSRSKVTATTQLTLPGVPSKPLLPGAAPTDPNDKFFGPAPGQHLSVVK